jgi:uncharacterized protein YjiS (DUF1127 family)
VKTGTQEIATMSTIHGASDLAQSAASTRHITSLLRKYWVAFEERRRRNRLRAALSHLSDRELMDIGMTRGEIDYTASNRDIDPRGGIRFAKWARHLPTVDGQIAHLWTDFR